MTTNVKFLAIKSAIFQMGLKYNQEPSDAKITAYAKELMDYTPEQISYAFKKTILAGSSFFPSLAEILKHLRPETESNVDRAPVIATEMLNLLRSYGQYSEKEMLEAASEDARATFVALGHTSDIRNSENIDTVRAQLRDLARGVLAGRDARTKNENLQRLGIDTGRVLEMKRPELRTMDYSNFLPENPA